jgi:hypothetical protein
MIIDIKKVLREEEALKSEKMFSGKERQKEIDILLEALHVPKVLHSIIDLGEDLGPGLEMDPRIKRFEDVRVVPLYFSKEARLVEISIVISPAPFSGEHAILFIFSGEKGALAVVRGMRNQYLTVYGMKTTWEDIPDQILGQFLAHPYRVNQTGVVVRSIPVALGVSSNVDWCVNAISGEITRLKIPMVDGFIDWSKPELFSLLARFSKPCWWDLL